MHPLELDHITLGYMPLLDCAALVIAAEKGFYHELGLEVTLQQEPSWANIRDKVAFGMLDGAQMLAGMPIAMSLGASPMKVPMITGFSMGLNGNAITVSKPVYDELQRYDSQIHATPQNGGNALKSLIRQRAAVGAPPLVIAHVYNYSSHNYLLRYWLASVGIDPDEDIRLIVVAPQFMVDRLESGEIDGFCAGEPWNTMALEEDVGRVLLSGAEIWSRAPEKVLGVTRDWAQTNPRTHTALIKALSKASQWLDSPANKQEAAKILSETNTIPLSSSRILMSINGSALAKHLPAVQQDDISIVFQHHANIPRIPHAVWCIEQMYRWGYLDVAMDMQVAAEDIYKPDLYINALQIKSPESTQEIAVEEELCEGETVFCNNALRVVKRMHHQKIHKRAVDIALLERLNPPSER